MSTKRKAEDQLNFKNYLDKKSRVYGNENIDYDDEEEMFENGCHPIQKDTAAAFKKLDRLMQQNQQQTQQQNQQQNQQQPQSSFQNSILMNTQSTARTSTQMLNLTTQNESFTVPELPEFNTQYNTQFLEEVSKEWQVSQAIINDLTELTDSRDSSGNRLSQNTTTQLDEDIIGLTPKICHVLTTARGLKNLYAWQKRCLRQPNVKHFQSLCYQVPTGGGKSLIAEILILKQIFQKQKDAVLVLPYVSLVQEKVASFSMLGTKLNFLVEEYAAGKGSLPPMNRRKTNTLYICTIEKGSALIDSLMFESRLSEIGIVVVDEIHMLYEVGKRGGTLEALVTKVKLHKETKIQIIGMSATIPNLTKVSEFLQGSKFENSERPVVLQHYVKDGGSIFKARVYNNKTGIEFDFCRSVGGNQKDVDGVMDLVSEVTEKEGGSVIVFCATKRQCESLAISYTNTMISKNKAVNTESKSFNTSRLSDSTQHAYSMLRDDARGQLCPVLKKCIPAKAAYHHAGLTPDERRTIEHMYSNGSVNVLFATSTLAAGVNLGADRVIVRSPKVGINVLDPSKYRQMAGRAGRAGKNDQGECILIIPKYEKRKILDDAGSEPAWDIPNTGYANENCIDPCVAGFAKSMVFDCLPSGKSQLDHVFSEFLLSCIVGGVIKDLRGCMSALNGTLWGRESKETPLERLADLTGKLELIEKQGLIHLTGNNNGDVNNMRIYISKLGDACVRSGMTPDEVLKTIARVRGILHPIYLTSVLSLIYLVVDNEAASRFIGYKQTHRDGRADLLNSYANAIDRLSATERDIVTQTFGVTTHTIATKQFGMSTISTGFTKPKLKKNPSASVIGEQEKINISTEKNDAEKNSVLVCNSSTVDGSEAPSLSVSSAEPSPMQSSYKNLDKVRKMLIDAAKSIPKKPTYDSEELDRNLIACLAVYECRIKQKGIQFITENYKVSRGDVQQLCTAVSTNCSTLARFCEIIHTGDQALSILQKKVEHDFPENEEMSVMVQASHTLWILSPILRNLTSTLRYGSLGELVELLDIPSIGMGRAKQLQRAGFTNLEKLANACCDDLVSKVEFLSRKVAMKILSAARNKIKDRLSVIEESFLTVQKETKFQGYDINQ